MFQIMRHQQTRDKHGIKRKLDVGKAAEGNCAYAWRLCMSIMHGDYAWRLCMAIMHGDYAMRIVS